MTEATDSTPRGELREEYFKVVDILQSYDPYFLTIKNWGVTVSGAAIALSVSQKSSSAFLLVCILAVGFWTTEVRFKLLQLGHTLRVGGREPYRRAHLRPARSPERLRHERSGSGPLAAHRLAGPLGRRRFQPGPNCSSRRGAPGRVS